MLCIFVLAGAFASVAKALGGVEAMVDVSLWLLPSSLILVGLFVSSCLVSLSVGTSCGTIAALTPIAAGMSSETGYSVAMLTGVVVGGAFFGDNLSFISDTTIAASRTLGCRMRDKFVANLGIALPAAALCIVGYAVLLSHPDTSAVTSFDTERLPLTIPYLFILICALFGMNVLLLLAAALILSISLGLVWGHSFHSLMLHAWSGVMGMGQLILVTIIAAIAIEAVRRKGWLSRIVATLQHHATSQRAAELSMAGLVTVADILTANNTIAILSVGPFCKEMAERYHIDRRRAASILDTFSCTAQGFLPYGAQLLIAAGLAKLSPFAIIPHLHYPFVLGVAALLYILLRKSDN